MYEFRIHEIEFMYNYMYRCRADDLQIKRILFVIFCLARSFCHKWQNNRYFVTNRTRFSQVFSYIIQLRQKDSRQSFVTL